MYSVEFKMQVGQFAQTNDVTTTIHKFEVSEASVKKWRRMFRNGDFPDQVVDETSLSSEERWRSRKRNKAIKYCSKLKEDVMKYYEEGHSREETAKKFNVSVSVVKHIRFLEKKKKAKVDVKEDIVDEAFNFDGEKNITKTLKNSPSLKKQVLHYLDAGHSQEGTAKRFGISRFMVRKFASSREEAVDCTKEASILATNPRKRKRE